LKKIKRKRSEREEVTTSPIKRRVIKVGRLATCNLSIMDNYTLPVYVCEDERNQHEEMGHYHFDSTQVGISREIKRKILSSEEHLKKSRETPYLSVVPFSSLMPWVLQAWHHGAHRECRSSHRFMMTRLVLAEARCLKLNLPYLKGIAPTTAIGNIWVTVCNTGKTTFNYLILNKVFNYEAAILANVYEVITTNDLKSFYVVVTAHTLISTDAIVAKFWLEGEELKGGFHHFATKASYFA